MKVTDAFGASTDGNAEHRTFCGFAPAADGRGLGRPCVPEGAGLPGVTGGSPPRERDSAPKVPAEMTAPFAWWPPPVPAPAWSGRTTRALGYARRWLFAVVSQLTLVPADEVH